VDLLIDRPDNGGNGGHTLLSPHDLQVMYQNGCPRTEDLPSHIREKITVDFRGYDSPYANGRNGRTGPDIFGPGANPEKRYVATYEAISVYCEAMRKLGLRIVYTGGVFDLIHIGHERYLEQARSFGHVLVVGVELDEAVRIRKGKGRPVTPFSERVEMMTHSRHVDMVVPIAKFDERGLSCDDILHVIQPHVCVVSERSFPEADDTADWVRRMQDQGIEVQMLKSQAQTSTSNQIRSLVMEIGELAKRQAQEVHASIQQTNDEVQQGLEEALSSLARATADLQQRVAASTARMSQQVEEGFDSIRNRVDEAVKTA
jgi:cytidyltransferase-like protein